MVRPVRLQENRNDSGLTLFSPYSLATRRLSDLEGTEGWLLLLLLLLLPAAVVAAAVVIIPCRHTLHKTGMIVGLAVFVV